MRRADICARLSPVRLRCLIVDDNEPFLDSARRLLESDDLHIVGVATTAAQAVQLAEERGPDIALVDVELREEDGFEVARQLVTAQPELRVIMISTHSEDDLATLVAQSPALGFLAKSRLTPAAVRALVG
jgi:DNA-binding NarL/FixJ family response regulator